MLARRLKGVSQYPTSWLALTFCTCVCVCFPFNNTCSPRMRSLLVDADGYARRYIRGVTRTVLLRLSIARPVSSPVVVCHYSRSP